MRFRCYLSISEAEAKRFDERLKEFTAFESRTEFLTACIHVFMHGETGKEHKSLDPATKKWLTDGHELALKNKKIREEYFEILAGFGFPILAIHGRSTLLTKAKNDLILEMMERCKAVPSNEEMEKWTKMFEEIHAAELSSYRSNILKSRFEEENV